MYKKPQKRCDICLVRRAGIKIKAVDAVEKLRREADYLHKKLNEAVERNRPAKPEWLPLLESVEASIKRIKEKGYAEVCPICAHEPKIVVLRYVENKVYEVPDEVCLDCPMQWEWICRFGEKALSEKEQRRRDRLMRELGRVILCV